MAKFVVVLVLIFALFNPAYAADIDCDADDDGLIDVDFLDVAAGVGTILKSADASEVRTNSGLEIGSDVQAYDADLDSIGGGVTGIVKGAGDAGGYSAATADTDYAAARFTKGLTMGSLVDQDATPDVTGGGTGISGNDHYWQTANTASTTITDFDDGDDHSEFSSGDWFILRVDDANTIIDFSGNANIIGNAGVDFTGSATQITFLHFVWDGTRWVCVNFVDGLSNPTTMGISALKLPTAADPDLTAEGQVSYDSDAANVSGDEAIRASDGTNQWLVARKLKCIHATAIKPQDWADAARDKFVIWENASGMTFTVVSWSGKSGTDNTTLAIMEGDADGQNPTTVDAVEIATDGTGLYYGSDTTITAGTIETGHILYLDFDDTDDPAWVKMTICGWYNADVD